MFKKKPRNIMYVICGRNWFELVCCFKKPAPPPPSPHRKSHFNTNRTEKLTAKRPIKTSDISIIHPLPCPLSSTDHIIPRSFNNKGFTPDSAASNTSFRTAEDTDVNILPIYMPYVSNLPNQKVKPVISKSTLISTTNSQVLNMLSQEKT